MCGFFRQKYTQPLKITWEFGGHLNTPGYYRDTTHDKPETRKGKTSTLLTLGLQVIYKPFNQDPNITPEDGKDHGSLVLPFL